jgi:hypothetical protein
VTSLKTSRVPRTKRRHDRPASTLSLTQDHRINPPNFGKPGLQTPCPLPRPAARKSTAAIPLIGTTSKHLQLPSISTATDSLLADCKASSKFFQSDPTEIASSSPTKVLSSVVYLGTRSLKRLAEGYIKSDSKRRKMGARLSVQTK